MFEKMMSSQDFSNSCKKKLGCCLNDLHLSSWSLHSLCLKHLENTVNALSVQQLDCSEEKMKNCLILLMFLGMITFYVSVPSLYSGDPAMMCVCLKDYSHVCKLPIIDFINMSGNTCQPMHFSVKCIFVFSQSNRSV